MSYERCVATLKRLRKEHANDPEALAKLDEMDREIAFVRAHEEVSALIIARAVIEKAQRSSRR